jgi:hypothetical protein
MESPLRFAPFEVSRVSPTGKTGTRRLRGSSTTVESIATDASDVAGVVSPGGVVETAWEVATADVPEAGASEEGVPTDVVLGVTVPVVDASGEEGLVVCVPAAGVPASGFPTSGVLAATSVVGGGAATSVVAGAVVGGVVGGVLADVLSGVTAASPEALGESLDACSVAWAVSFDSTGLTTGGAVSFTKAAGAGRSVVAIDAGSGVIANGMDPVAKRA